MKSYIIQSREQKLYLSMVKSLERVLFLETGLSHYEAKHRLKHSYGIIEVSDEQTAKRVSEAFEKLGLENFVLTEKELVVFPKTRLLSGRLPGVGGEVRLIAAGIFLKETPLTGFRFRTGPILSSIGMTGKTRVENITYIDILTSGEHFRTFFTSIVVPKSIRLGLKEIVNNASAVHLSESAKGIIKGKPSLIGRFPSEQYYDRYVSWLVQLRYSKHGPFRHVEAPPQKRTVSSRIRIKVPGDVFKLTTQDAPAKREDKAPISSPEEAPRPEEKGERSMPATAATAADTKTIGRYRILGEIGEGGMGVVYKAEQISLGRLVAMKVLPRRLAGDSTFVRRFLNEARAMAAVNHPNIVLIYDVGQEGETNYYTMELVDGASLEALLLQQSILSSKRAVNIVAMILNALGHMHKCGIVHRDVKPSNIMIERSGTAKLMDFGLALQEKSERLTKVGGIVGTPEYMSPEQAAGGTATALSDIYSLGVVFYELLTGNVPFEADTPLGVIHKIWEEEPASPRSINPRIPAGLQRIVLKMMARDPKGRYQNCRAIRADLKKFRAGKLIRPLRPSFFSSDFSFKKAVAALVHISLAAGVSVHQNCRAILADLRKFRAGELVRPLRPSFFSSDFSFKKAVAALLLISLIAGVGVYLYRTTKGPLPEERKEIPGLQIVELQKSLALLEDQLHTLRVESEINEVRVQIHETKNLIKTLEHQFLQGAGGHVSAGAERKRPILAICVAAGYVGLLLALLFLGFDLRPTKRILIAFAVLLSLGILDWYNVLNPCESPFFDDCLNYPYAHHPSVFPGLYPPLLFEEACVEPHQQVVNHLGWICTPNTWSLAFVFSQSGKTPCTASCHVSVVSWYYTALHWYLLSCLIVSFWFKWIPRIFSGESRVGDFKGDDT